MAVDHKASGETRITRAPGQTPPCRWCDADHPRAFNGWPTGVPCSPSWNRIPWSGGIAKDSACSGAGRRRRAGDYAYRWIE